MYQKREKYCDEKYYMRILKRQTNDKDMACCFGMGGVVYNIQPNKDIFYFTVCHNN